jgi:2-hydroxychromene-2-carboxylate isomerase
MAQERSNVDFWFDPGCPFTWRTSRWLLDVARQRPVEVTWHLLSLAILNESKDVPEEYRERIRRGVRALRVLAAAEEEGGQPALARLYTALGTRRHVQGQEYEDNVLREAVAAAGLPARVADAAGDESLDARVRASHDEGEKRVGTEVGSPVVAIDGGRGFFGPVVVPVPAGPEAVRLFDAVQALSAIPAFSELKTARAPLDAPSGGG